MAKISGIWLRFVFKLPKDQVLELTGKNSRCFGKISWQAIGIWLGIHFSGQRLMHWLPSPIILAKILHLRYQFEKSAEIYIILTNQFRKMFSVQLKVFKLLDLAYPFINMYGMKRQKCRNFFLQKWQFYSDFLCYIFSTSSVKLQKVRSQINQEMLSFFYKKLTN